MDKRKRKHQWY